MGWYQMSKSKTIKQNSGAMIRVAILSSSLGTNITYWRGKSNCVINVDRIEMITAQSHDLQGGHLNGTNNQFIACPIYNNQGLSWYS